LDVLSGNQVKQLKGHKECVNSVSFSPDGKYLVTGSSDYSVIIWDAVSRNQIKEFTVHTSFVNSVSFSPDGKYIVSE
jgi:WD40 repeat protein